MAGDVGLEERVIVAPTGVDDIGAAAAGPVAEGIGRVVHRYGPRVLVFEQGTESAEALAAAVPGAEVGDSGAEVSDSLVAGLDETGRLGLEAFRLRSTEDYAGVKAQRPLAGESWDHAHATVPDLQDVEGEAAASAPASGPTSSRLTGSVAVGIIIVEGPTVDLRFSGVERTQAVAEVQICLCWGGARGLHGGVTWAYDIRIVRVAAPPDPATPALEALWRDPAMSQLGFGTGMGAVTSYVQKLRVDLATTWAYCAFFTKYPVGHFAYASIGGPRLVMQYANDGWGPDNIDRVFTHETGHIFGAPDEYASSNCNCGGSWGFFQEPNTNCAVCASGGGVECIMRANTWAMCEWTPRHLGFRQVGSLPLAAGTYAVQQLSSGRFLDAFLTPGDDSSVVTRPDQPSDSQRWRFTPVGMVHTVQQVSSGRILDAHEDSAEDFSAVTRTAEGNDTQRWVALPVATDASVSGPSSAPAGTPDGPAAFGIGVPDQPPPPGVPTYTLRQLSSGWFLDAHESSANDYSAVVRTAQDNDTQRWAVTANGGDSYTVVQLSSGRFLDAHESSANDYSAVTRTAQGNDTQRWTFTPVGAVYEIQQVSSDRYLDAHETSAQDYSVVTRTAQQDDTQRWVVTRVDGNEYTLVQLSSRRFLDAYESAPNDYSAVTRTAQGNDTQRWVIT
jgi:hypothetical protein